MVQTAPAPPSANGTLQPSAVNVAIGGVQKSAILVSSPGPGGGSGERLHRRTLCLQEPIESEL